MDGTDESPTPNDPRQPSGQQLDPVFLAARREAKTVLTIFVAFAAYCLTVSYIFGHWEAGGSEISLLFGMPAWVFWGIFVPWIAAIVVTGWFCFYFMESEGRDTGDAAGQNSPQQGQDSTGGRS